MQAPDAIKTLWDAVFGQAGQDGLSQRMAAVEKDTENNTARLDRMNGKLDRIMLLLLSSGASIIGGLVYLIVQG